MTAANPGYADRHADALARPDGDVELDDTASFVVPGCEDCGGPLKPDVVFFGENVPRTAGGQVLCGGRGARSPTTAPCWSPARR